MDVQEEIIEVGSRRVHLAGCTYNPGARWVAQQARNLAWKVQDGGLRAHYLLRDRDSKFSAAFDEVFKSEGVKVLRLPYRRQVANAFAERFVSTCRREVFHRLLIFSQQHLERVLAEFFDHYNHARPHQGIEQRRPCEPADVIPLPTAQSSAETGSEACFTSTAGRQPDEVTEEGVTHRMVTSTAAPPDEATEKG